MRGGWEDRWAEGGYMDDLVQQNFRKCRDRPGWRQSLAQECFLCACCVSRGSMRNRARLCGGGSVSSTPSSAVMTILVLSEAGGSRGTLSTGAGTEARRGEAVVRRAGLQGGESAQCPSAWLRTPVSVRPCPRARGPGSFLRLPRARLWSALRCL